MSDNFSREEKINYMLMKHIKNHLLEYVFDFIGPIILTALILYLCEAEKFSYGIIFSVAYSVGRLAYNLHHYKKEHLNIDIK